MSILIDVSPMIHRSVYMNRDNVIENPKIICHLVASMILSSADKFGACKDNPIVLVIDGKNNWRKTFYEKNCSQFPEYENQKYKGNRVKDVAFDWDAIYQNMNDLIQSMKLYTDFQVIEVDRAEADDVIAVYCKNAPETETVTIITSDKDMKQCQKKNVQMYDPIKQIFIPDIDVERFKTIHCMIGDKSDNILAIRPRLGEKTAEKILHELDDLLSTNPDMRKKYEFNRTLIDFDYIPEDVVTEIKEAMAIPPHSYNMMELSKCFMKMNLQQLSEKMIKFKLTNKKVDAKIVNTEIQKQKKEEFENGILDKFFD